jgi:chemotaxis protein MotB
MINWITQLPKLKMISSMFQSRFLLLSLTLLSLSSCVSNKKHKAAIDLINTQHQTEVTELQGQIDTDKNKIKELELNVAERIGENNILLMLRDELQGEVEMLEGNIENLNNSSTSTQQSLSADLAKKEQTIKQLRGFLAEVDSTITQHENIIQQIIGDLNLIAQEYPDDIEVSLGFDYAIIDIKESFLFKRNSTSRLEDKGFETLEKFSTVFQKYPGIKVQVVGHTDTAPPKEIKRYQDNWNFSALQSATIVRTLIDEYDVNSNQLTLAAKAASAPKASNSTAEGKSKNRRIEMNLSMEAENLVKKIRKVLSKVK